jgi:chitinase
MVDEQGYDGIDIDWEFPASTEDRAALTALVRELRAALGGGRSLSIAGPGSDWYGQWYDIPALEPHLTWFASMTYTFAASSWSPAATHNSALYGPLSVDAARKYFVGRGLPPRKFLAGIPFYGERFDGAANIGEELTTRTGGAVEYPEIAKLAGSGWTRHRDTAAGRMPYLVREGGRGVIVYDDAQSIPEKCAYAVEHGLGGVIVWRLGQDLVDGGTPLLRAIRGCR